MRCITCHDELPTDRAEWGYDCCVKPECVEKNFAGTRLVEVTVNKNAPQLVAAGAIDQALKEARNGYYAKKNPTPGPTTQSGPVDRTSARKRRVTPRAAPTRGKRWTPQQEKMVKVFNEMGLRPHEMLERAPHLQPQRRSDHRDRLPRSSENLTGTRSVEQTSLILPGSSSFPVVRGRHPLTDPRR
jgi:hypothetical protein